MGFSLGGAIGGLLGGTGPLSSFTSLLGGGGGSPPGAPNIDQTAQQQLAYGQQVQGMNAPNQYGLFGQTTYDKNAAGGITGIHTGLNPQMQALYQSLMGGLGTRPNDVADSVYGQYASRLDPLWQTKETQLNDQLANQGIPMGSEAWNNARGEFGRERTDAYQTANRAAQLAGGQEQSRLLSGLFGLGGAATAGYQNAPQIAAPNTMGAAYQNFGAAQDAYNQRQASQNANMQGLFQLGASVLPFLL